jgi:CPA1 family monovalent cation:H+ antiporter
MLVRRIRETEPRPPWPQVFFIGFTGIRGVVSLAAALSIPLTAGGEPFPGRGLILFVSFAVIIVTLVGQGSLLAWLIGRLGLGDAGRAEAAHAKNQEVRARIAGVRATLMHLDRLAAAGAKPSAVAVLRRRHEDRLAEFMGIADARVPGNPAVEDALLQAKLIEAERRQILAIYGRGELSDEARRRIEREFDLEDARNLHLLESASGDRSADPETESEPDLARG